MLWEAETLRFGNISFYGSHYISLVYEPRSDNRGFLAIKVKSEIFTEKERPIAVVNIYRKFEEIIFRNNKDMSN